jgi:arylformamidase
VDPYDNFMDQSQIDPQLDIENHIWDIIPYFDTFLSRSAQTLGSLEHEVDIPVGARDEERIDVFPAKQKGAPIIIFIHGGWWRLGTRKLFNFCVKGLADLGFTCISSDYALCPKVGIPDITAASRLAVAWAYRNAESINGDPERIFVTGHSAGGHQVGMLAVTDWQEYGLPSDVIKGGIPISGLFDLRPFRYSWLQPKLQLTGDVVFNESPLFHIPESGPPLLVALGGTESVEFHRQSEEFVAAWRERGLRADYFDVEGEDHNTNVFRLFDSQGEITQAIHKFAQSC